MSGWTISVDAPWRFEDGDETTYNLTYQVNGCFSPPYGHIFKNGGDDLYLTHSKGETFLGDGWNGFVLLDFKVNQLSPCEIDETTQKYDCINGACIKAEVYNTPGIYNGLDECEVACGEGCSGKCLSKNEWQKIQDLANKLKQINCK
ncbi:hypothetical protein IQ247_13735 [Plectonema cf. radiosum LEGE 06105]|uniref:Uncharacterized protein n=1 Tax=Plectonema cf. radiosum LEGE 06105 TaxID=945769 RepID=A0A8J7FCJ6_9CYAN|nr:hypothetical protein [Plectonema radiosum]MBE9213713.1 hypothetical protein [Plectonema cf. radiosum LEGE 06105]